MSDKRRRSRIKAAFEASLEVDGLKVPARTEDISLKGVLLQCDKRLPEGVDGTLRLNLGTGLRLAMDGKVLRSDGVKVAMDFAGMDDESFFHLFQLIRLNADDPDRIEDELSEPAF